MDSARFFDAVLRHDLNSFTAKTFGAVVPGTKFLPNWHLEAIAWRLQCVLDGDIKRLLITMPPRSLKSVFASVALPAFALGRHPSKRIVCVSYAEDLAAKHARDCRAVLESGWYRRLFPGTRLSRTRSAGLDFETTRHGGRLSTSVGGALTGRGGSLIVVDDPQKPADAMSDVKRASTLDWFRNTLMSRLDDKREDAIIVVMQRLHVDDLAGYLIEAGGWTHLDLPAIAEQDVRIEIGRGRFHHRKADEVLHEAREPRRVLEQIKTDMGDFHFTAQYQQRPVPAEGNLVQASWFGAFIVPPAKEPGIKIVQSWDLAVKDGQQNDYSVCVTAHVKGNAIYITDIYRARLDYPAQRKAVVRLAREHGARIILIEDAANGSPLVADLRHLDQPGVSTPIPVKPKGSKIERLSVQSSRIEAGDVRLPQSAPWLDAFNAEILAFPYGRHDDQVDALSQLMAWTGAQNRRSRIGMHPPELFLIED